MMSHGNPLRQRALRIQHEPAYDCLDPRELALIACIIGAVYPDDEGEARALTERETAGILSIEERIDDILPYKDCALMGHNNPILIITYTHYGHQFQCTAAKGACGQGYWIKGEKEYRHSMSIL